MTDISFIGISPMDTLRRVNRGSKSLPEQLLILLATAFQPIPSSGTLSSGTTSMVARYAQIGPTIAHHPLH